MANIIENIREVLGDKQINLTFLTDRESVKKTYTNDAVKAGFIEENVHFTTELTKSHDLARTEKFNEGSVPLHTLRADIDYATARALTTYGIIGIKVWLFKGESKNTKNNSSIEKVSS